MVGGIQIFIFEVKKSQMSSKLLKFVVDFDYYSNKLFHILNLRSCFTTEQFSCPFLVKHQDNEINYT
jgi:hypothetical protein